MQQQNILKLDLSNFPIDDRAAQIEGKLFLIDNLNDPITIKDKLEMNQMAQVNMVVIFICKAGRVDVEINRKNYTLRGGQVMTLLSGFVFQFINAWENTECAVMAINKDFVNYVSDIKTGMEFARAITETPVYSLDYPNMEETIGIYKALKHKLYQSDFLYKEQIAKNYLDILKCNAFNTFSKISETHPNEKVSTRKEELLSLFIKNVQKYYKMERNVTFYADKLCVTPKYLSSVIHEVSGKYATEWINNYVIMEAKNMLKNEGRSVKDVCNRLNFANQSFFAKYFKQHTGLTPKEFKNM